MDIKGIRQITCPKPKSLAVLAGSLIGLILMYITLLRSFADIIKPQDITYVGLQKDVFHIKDYYGKIMIITYKYMMLY